MKEKVLSQLKLKYPGVSNEFLGIVADKLSAKVTKEDEIEGAISEFDSNVSISDLSKLLQKEGDKRATEAVKTHEEKLKEKFDLVEKKKADEAKPPKTDDPNLEIMQKLESLDKELKEMRAKESLSNIKNLAISKLKEKKIPEKFLGMYKLEKEEDIESVVAQAEADYVEFRQGLINEGLVAETPKGSTDNKGISESTQAYIKDLTSKEANLELSGKEI